VLKTLGAPRDQRAARRRRRPRRLKRTEAVTAPTARVTVIRAEALEGPEEAAAWLEALRRDPERLRGGFEWALRELNALIRAYRAAASDPYARDLSAASALVARAGYGEGDEVADGRFTDAFEAALAPRRPRRRAERLAPEERLASMLGGREPLPAADELVLRARTDVEVGRPREAALQARIALECLLAETSGTQLGDLRPELERDRSAVSEAAAVALSDDPPKELVQRVGESVGRMEAALRRRRGRAPR
jgi:hypothetical protein